MTKLEGKGAAVLVAGGAGYIGAHTAKALAESGFRPVVFDNLSSGFREAVRWGELVHGDIRDGAALREAITGHAVEAVIHFASLIEVGRSMVRPDLFYEHNVTGTASLLKAMADCGVGRLVFSSSAAVYGHSEAPLLKEGDLKDPVSPYGDTKLACERMIAAHARAFGFSAVALRYFNAAGADSSGLIGEAHRPETHLIPLAIAAGLGRGKPLTVFGDDFPTPDGTCLRDYIHVEDLAVAHVKALAADVAPGGFEAVNVGTGRGWSVLEVISAVERALGAPVPHSVGERRAGDPATLVADASRAGEILGWAPVSSSLDQIVESAATWHRNQKFG
jgi:UDP-glucose-4-epimerase GalE